MNPYRLRIALACAVVMGAPQPAVAWQQYRSLPPAADGSPAGCGLRWQVAEIPLSLDATTLDGLETADVAAVASTAAQTWQSVSCELCSGCAGGASTTVACAAHPLGVQFLWTDRGKPTEVGGQCADAADTSACTEVTSNGNWVQFVHSAELWAQQGMPKAVVAVTVLTYSRQTGEIRDADLLLDDVHHDFCISPTCTGGRYDLQQTLTHELGHVLGLDHSTLPEATMYAAAQPGETQKQTLADDDRTGVCTAYHTQCDACAEAPEPGCSAGRALAWPGLALVGLLAVAGLLARRTHRRAIDFDCPRR